MKRIVIIGAGISELAAAYFLTRRHHVWLFEKEPRFGGHTHVSEPDCLFREIGIETQASDMCFAVICRRTGLEYSSRGARGFFAQRQNVFRPAHLRLQMYHAENIGTHYARTLHPWRERFHASVENVRALGFDQRVVRMWDLYLAYCEAAFLERHAGDFQLVLAKNGITRTLFNEPWENTTADAMAVA